MFCIGDKVSCPLHGAGVIENIEKRVSDLGETDYFVVRLLGLGMKITIPIASAHSSGIRFVVSRETAQSILDDFRELVFEFDNNWTKRYRDNMDRLRTGDLFEVAKVYKSLAERNRIKGLSAGERKMLQSSKQILTSELMLSLDCEKTHIENLLIITTCE